MATCRVRDGIIEIDGDPHEVRLVQQGEYDRAPPLYVVESRKTGDEAFRFQIHGGVVRTAAEVPVECARAAVAWWASHKRLT
jgi:hypothetical protein